MKSKDIPYRQIHLDFHTSPLIPGVGADFDAGAFARTLKGAHVNSINLFAKCHHGMYYYPTKLGTVHPTLPEGLDLFGEQMRVCRENEIRAVAYTCVAWSEDWADRHPEWLCVNYEGLVGNKMPFEARWNTLCINNPEHRAFNKEEFKEIYDLYKPDGYWIDIVISTTCVCPHCKRDMKEKGLDPQNIADVRRHDRMVEIDYCREMYEYLMGIDPDLEIYFNSHPYSMDNASDLETSSATKREYFSFLDIESLPSEGWGYNHFPVAARYVEKYEKPLCMMNGKFHFSWGDFGSMRNLEALEYESFRALAHGARVCIGDQLHPRGVLDPVVYARIGEVLASVEQKEPWLYDSKAVAEVGVFIAEPEVVNDGKGCLTDEGVYRVLSECHIPFEYLNLRDPIGRYKLLILPDDCRIDAQAAQRINEYRKNGGKVLITGKSALGADGKFLLDFIDAEYLGESPFAMRYIRLTDPIFENIPKIDHVTYTRSHLIKSAAKTLAMTVDPYFDRRYDHFCSHRQTPPDFAAANDPAIIGGEGWLYCAAPLFTDYINSGYQAHKLILEACINALYDRPLIKTDLPYLSEITLRAQENSLTAHVLNYVKEKKAKRIEIIEAKYLVRGKTLSIRADAAPKRVISAPDGSEMAFRYEDGYVNIEIPFAEGHTMYCVEMM